MKKINQNYVIELESLESYLRADQPQTLINWMFTFCLSLLTHCP